MSMSKPYVFPGITNFVARDGIPPYMAAKIPGLFFVARVTDALSQLPAAHAPSRPDMLKHAEEWRAGLVAALKTVDAAIADVKANCFPAPDADASPSIKLRSK